MSDDIDTTAAAPEFVPTKHEPSFAGALHYLERLNSIYAGVVQAEVERLRSELAEATEQRNALGVRLTDALDAVDSLTGDLVAAVGHTGAPADLLAELAERAEQAPRRDPALLVGVDTHWPVFEVLRHLVRATGYLLDDYNYDRHGWETIDHARRSGIEHLTAAGLDLLPAQFEPMGRRTGARERHLAAILERIADGDVPNPVALARKALDVEAAIAANSSADPKPSTCASTPPEGWRVEQGMHGPELHGPNGERLERVPDAEHIWLTDCTDETAEVSLAAVAFYVAMLASVSARNSATSLTTGTVRRDDPTTAEDPAAFRGHEARLLGALRHREGPGTEDDRGVPERPRSAPGLLGVGRRRQRAHGRA